MSRWDTQLEEHAIWGTLKEIHGHLDKQFDDVDGDLVVELRRLVELVSNLSAIMKEIEAEKTSFAIIDAIDNSLTQHIVPQTSAFSTNGNLDNLKQANDQFTGILPDISVLAALAPKKEKQTSSKQLNKIVDDFAKAVSSKAQSLTDDLDDLSKTTDRQNTRQNDLENQINAKKQETDSLISGWQDQFSQAQDQRSNEFNNLRTKIDDDAAEKTDQLISEKDTKLTKFVSTKEISITAATEKAETDLKELVTNTKTELETLLKDAHTKHQSILDLYEIVAGDSVAAGYINNANEERDQANTWRKFTVGFIITTTVWILGVFVVQHFVNGSSWTWYLPVFSLTGVLLLGSAYSAQQSTKHRNNEKRDRWFALQIKAFDPFINSLTDEQQQELKKEISTQLFGSQHSDDDEKIGNEHVLSVLTKSVTDILKAAQK